MKTKISYAKPEQLFQIIEVLRDGYEDSLPYFPGIEFPFIYHELIELMYKGLAIVAVADGRVIGFAALDENSMPWAPSKKFLNNKFYIVLKEFRAKTDAGDQLLVGMRQIAALMRMDLVISVNSGTDAERKVQFLEHKGGQLMGANVFFAKPEEAGVEG